LLGDVPMRSESLQLSDGRILQALAWDPPAPAERAVLLLHGVESHAAWFAEVAEPLAAQGLAVRAFDRAGWGASPGLRGHLASYRDAVREVVEVATALRAEFSEVHLAGLSWGGLLALYVTLRRGALFDSLTLIAPGICSHTRLSAWQDLRVAAGVLAGGAGVMIPLPIRAEEFTRRADRLAYIQSDPARVRAVSAAFCLETLKMRRFVAEHAARRGLPPAQALLAGEDSITDNARTRTLLAPARMAVREYANAAHSLVFEAPEGVAAEIASLAGSARSVPEPAHVVVMGAGAVGSLVGGLLALAGHRVTLIARRAHCEAVQQQGLCLRVGEGERRVRGSLSAVETPAAVGLPADLVILAVKSFDTDAALAALQPLVEPATAILSLQNGVANEPRIVDAFPGHTILAGAICAYVEFSRPGEIVWADDQGGLAGALVHGEEREARRIWERILPCTGLEARYCDPDGAGCTAMWQRVKWSKLMLNLAFNALNGVTGLATPAILAHPRYGSLAVRALQEGFRVMRRLAIGPVDLPGYPVTQMARLAELPVTVVRRLLAWKTAAQASGASSMRQDLLRGRAATEIDAINGAVVRAGASCGVSTPANQELCAMVAQAAGSAPARE